MREPRKLLKFQKNCFDRRKMNPTVANPVEMIRRPIVILTIPHTQIEFDAFTNERTNMSGDEMKRKFATGTMKLKIPTNDNTKSRCRPNEARLPTKTAFINTKKRKRHCN
jgi:hypothetical protein